MNICSFSKASLVIASLVIAGVVTSPQKAYASETGTLPVIHVPLTQSLSLKTKDNGTIPVIVVPNPQNVSGDGSGSLNSGNTYTITIGVNQPSTDDQPITLTSNKPNLIQVPDSATVNSGESSVTTTFTVPYSTNTHSENVKIYATANGTTVETTIHVHYQGESN